MNEDRLEELRAVVYGDNHPYGGGITTYPDGDERNRHIYEGCCELERRGLVVRRTLRDGVVYFSGPAPKANPRG